jgi:hypothetical protein
MGRMSWLKEISAPAKKVEVRRRMEMRWSMR